MVRLIGSACLLAVLLAAPAVAAPAPRQTLARRVFAQVHMGVVVRVTFYAPDDATAVRGCRGAFARIAALEDVLSDYRPSSELMRLCRRAGSDPMPVSPDLFTVLDRALDLSRRSEGAFDPTVGPLVALWRIARRTGQLPDAGALDEARSLVGWRNVRLDAQRHTVQLLKQGMRLDLGGIAKGYAADCAAALLRQHGVHRAMVEAGGDIVVTGPPPDSPGWRISIPGAGPNGSTKVLALTQAAASSSGDTEQFVEIGGRRYSHVVDPRTGLGLTSRIAVTVVARDGLTSDGLATAVGVLGRERGMALVRSVPGASVYIRALSDR